MYNRLQLFWFFLIVSSSSLASQLQKENQSFSLAIAGAIPFSSPPTYEFINNRFSANIPPGFFGSIGLIYAPIYLKLIEPAVISCTAELSYSDLKSDEPSNVNLHSQMKLTHTRGILWLNLFVPAPVSPYVRMGLGITQVNFKEVSASGINLFINGLSLALGIGGGVSLVLSNQIDLRVFGDAILTTTTFAVYDDNKTQYGIFQAGAEPMFGLGMSYKL